MDKVKSTEVVVGGIVAAVFKFPVLVLASATRLPKTDGAMCAARVSSWAERPVCKAVGNTARTPTIPTAITPKAITTSSKLKLCVLALRLDAVARFMGWRLVLRVP